MANESGTLQDLSSTSLSISPFIYPVHGYAIVFNVSIHFLSGCAVSGIVGNHDDGHIVSMSQVNDLGH